MELRLTRSNVLGQIPQKVCDRCGLAGSQRFLRELPQFCKIYESTGHHWSGVRGKAR